MKTSDFTVKTRMIMATIFLVTFFGVIVMFYQYSIISKLVLDDFDDTPESFSGAVHNSFATVLTELKENIQIQTNFILRDKKIVKSFKDRDRKRLLALLSPLYQKLHEENPYLKIMTFRLSDGSAFLRLHKPSMHGDALNSKRKIIIDTNKLQKQHYGFEIGKLAMSYRIVTPIFYEAEHLGLIEIGIEPEYVSDKIDKLFKIKAALLVKKDSLDVRSDKKEFIDDFVFVRGDVLFKKNLAQISLQEHTSKIVFEGKTYIIDSNLNLYDHKGKVAAKVLFGHDIDRYNSHINSIIKDMLLNMSLFIMMLIILLNYFINYFLNKMDTLTEKLAFKRDELIKLNSLLEYKVAEEVGKNREKDRLLHVQAKSVQMGEMLSMIAHQWRQPLNAISASAMKISMQQELKQLDDHSILEHTRFVQNTTQNLSKIINDFMDFFKPEDDMQDFSFAEIIETTLSLIGTQLDNKGIRLLYHDDKCSLLHHYKKELVHVLINLINNAKDAYNGKDIKEKLIEVWCTQDEDMICIEIGDKAGGIEKEIIEKIFDPYFTTKEKAQGTGIGLYMTKRMIEEIFAGTITVSNEKDGALFKMQFPKIKKPQ